MIFVVILILIVISIAWAYYTYSQLKNIKGVREAKQDLKRGKVIFHSDSAASDRG